MGIKGIDISLVGGKSLVTVLNSYLKYREIIPHCITYIHNNQLTLIPLRTTDSYINVNIYSYQVLSSNQINFASNSQFPGSVLHQNDNHIQKIFVARTVVQLILPDI